MNRKMRSKLNNQRARRERETGRKTLYISRPSEGNCNHCSKANERHTELTVDMGDYDVVVERGMSPNDRSLN